MSETSVSSFWWNSRVTSFFPVAHWDTLDSGTSNAVLSFTSNDNSGPVAGEGVRNRKPGVISSLSFSNLQKSIYVFQ